MLNKGFCENCNKIVDYSRKEVCDFAEIKDKKYKFNRVIGVCKNCGQEVSSNDINDENLNRIDNAYRKNEGIITTEEINRILKKYKIGKKPLSKLPAKASR